MPGKNHAFTTRVDPVSPPSSLPTHSTGAGGNWWRRRVPPPGPLRLFRTAFIAIAGLPGMRNIGI